MSNPELVYKVISIPEIQDSIFYSRKLSISDLAHCTRVSKTWYKVATPYLWKFLLYPTKKIDQITREGLLRNVEWIQSLRVTRWEMVDWLTESENGTRLLRLILKLDPRLDLKSLMTDSSLSKDKEDWWRETIKMEKRDESLKKLILRNSGLKDFECCDQNKFQRGVFNPLIAKALTDSGFRHLERLELVYVFLENFMLADLLNKCNKIQRLIIQECAFEESYLDPFDQDLPSLQHLNFSVNHLVGFLEPSGRQISRGQDWFKLLKSARNSQRFRALNASCLPLTTNEVSELITIYSNLLSKISELSLFGGTKLDKDALKILKTVQPLTVLRFGHVRISVEYLEVLKSKHSETLEELTIWYGKPIGRAQGLLSTLQWPRLKCLMIHCDPMSFETLLPQLYPPQQSSYDDLNNDWTCLKLKSLVIRFRFDKHLELEALGGSLKSVVASGSLDEFFVKVFLLLMKQISKLVYIRIVDISVYYFEEDEMDHESKYWQDLNGCWEMFSDRKLEKFDLEWPVPEWINEEYKSWCLWKFGK